MAWYGQANVYQTRSANSPARREDLLQLATDDSSTDGFRSIIDDLTVENQKLKRRLKKYEAPHDSHLKDEKLFEVRIHGLPPGKKRELEDTLQRFATGLSNQPASDSPLGAGNDRLLPAAISCQTDPSLASNHFADSAYASASGQGSSAFSGQAGHHSRDLRLAQPSKSRQPNIHAHSHSSLHNIPEAPLPRQPTPLTEKAKKKLIVSRLEQVFAGTATAASGRQQPLHRQELSQMAVELERITNEARSLQEATDGPREAHVTHYATRDSMDTHAARATARHPLSDVPTQCSQSATQIAQHGFAEQHTPDSRVLGQRTTTALDLDIYRAQVPSGNTQSTSHLGFLPPSTKTVSTPDTGSGWIYLNLLTNIAQLHTLSVTVEYVTKAVNEYSSKLELSRDGRKVRWIGGRSQTPVGSDRGPSLHDNTTATWPDWGVSNKRLKFSHGSNTTSTDVPDFRPRSPDKVKQSFKHTYTPMFSHQHVDNGVDNVHNDSSSVDEGSLPSPFPAQAGSDPSGMTRSGVRSALAKKNNKKDKGTIIFYNNARFCTDLSGDQDLEHSAAFDSSLYNSVDIRPLGSKASSAMGSKSSSELRRPLAGALCLPAPPGLDDNSIPGSLQLDFALRPLGQATTSDRPPVVYFEASGVGGVYPADNFVIVMQQEQIRRDVMQESASPMPRLGLRSSKIVSILEEARRKSRAPVFCREMFSVERTTLPPSELPPASYFRSPSSTQPADDDDDDDDSVAETEEGISTTESSSSPPHSSPSHHTSAPSADAPPSAAADSEDFSSEEEEESDASVDFLATARRFDPEGIDAREREYDAHVAEGL
ncbi:hypothetical protein LTR28_003923, partial [Elasticomyces elasticus]